MDVYLQTGKREVYHTHRHCRYLSEDDTEMVVWDRETAEAWYRECKHCSGDYEPYADTGLSTNAIDK